MQKPDQFKVASYSLVAFFNNRPMPERLICMQLCMLASPKILKQAMHVAKNHISNVRCETCQKFNEN